MLNRSWASRFDILPIVEAVTLAGILLPPFALWSRPELITLATHVLILALLGVSFHLCWGYSGIISCGQALFFGGGGYVVAVVGRDLDFSPISGALPLAALSGLLLALAFAGFLLLGRKKPTNIFIALGTLTGSYAAERLVSGWQYVGAGNGLSAVKLLQIGPIQMVEGVPFYFLALVTLLVCYCGSRLLVRSPFGLVLAGRPHKQDRLTFLGYPVQRYQTIIFSLAAMIAGISGLPFAHHHRYIGPRNM